jgi:hypothetical protein
VLTASLLVPLFPKSALAFVVLLYIFFFSFAWSRMLAGRNDRLETPTESEAAEPSESEVAVPPCDGLDEHAPRAGEYTNFIAIPAVLPLLAMGDVFSTDYGSFAVILIFALHLIRRRKGQLLLLACGILYEYGVPLFTWGFNATNLMYLLFALIAVPVLCLYNGKQGIRLKWAFYGFYPAHIAVLALIWIGYVRPVLNGF